MDDVKRRRDLSDFSSWRPPHIIGNTAANWRAAKSPTSSALPATPAPAWMLVRLASYRKLHQAINSRLISACHDLPMATAAVLLAEMCEDAWRRIWP